MIIQIMTLLISLSYGLACPMDDKPPKDDKNKPQKTGLNYNGQQRPASQPTEQAGQATQNNPAQNNSEPRSVSATENNSVTPWPYLRAHTPPLTAQGQDGSNQSSARVTPVTPLNLEYFTITWTGKLNDLKEIVLDDESTDEQQQTAVRKIETMYEVLKQLKEKTECHELHETIDELITTIIDFLKESARKFIPSDRFMEYWATDISPFVLPECAAATSLLSEDIARPKAVRQSSGEIPILKLASAAQTPIQTQFNSPRDQAEAHERSLWNLREQVRQDHEIAQAKHLVETILLLNAHHVLNVVYPQIRYNTIRHDGHLFKQETNALGLETDDELLRYAINRPAVKIRALFIILTVLTYGYNYATFDADKM